ncbi:retrovirus-related pol polyprotein from transposon TNT 1-94 [Tanacetum coccineum]
MFKIDLEPLALKVLNNRDAHTDHIKHSQEHADTLYEIVEHARDLRALDSDLDFACKIVQRIQEVLVYVKATCPSLTKHSEKLVAITLLNKNKKVSASRSQPSGNTKKDGISQTTSSNSKNKVEDHPMSVKSSSNKMNRVIEPICDVNVKHTKLNANSEVICVKCNKCMFDANHDVCFLEFVNDVNVHSKSKSVKKRKYKNIWKPTGIVFTDIGYRWKPTGRTFTIVGNMCPLTRITSTKVVPLKKTTSKSVITQNAEVKVYSRRPKVIKSVGCPNCSLVFGLRMLQAYDRKLLSAHLGTVKLGNDQIAKIMGYGDYQIGKYRRLSHLNFDYITTLAKQGVVRGLPRLKFQKDHLCYACALDNGTEFVNQTLRAYYEDVRISHQTSVARNLQQNGVKPDLSYLYVFGALCYPTNDSEDLGKLKPKANIGIFVGYATANKALLIYNKRTRLITETIHVDFDELTAMASKQFSSGPEPHLLTPGTLSSGLVPNPPSPTPYEPPTKKDWDNLFQPMFDEYFNPPPTHSVSTISHVLQQTTTPIPTPSINTKAPPITIVAPE